MAAPADAALEEAERTAEGKDSGAVLGDGLEREEAGGALHLAAEELGLPYARWLQLRARRRGIERSRLI